MAEPLTNLQRALKQTEGEALMNALIKKQVLIGEGAGRLEIAEQTEIISRKSRALDQIGLDPQQVINERLELLKKSAGAS